MEGGNAGFASADGQRSWGADKRPGQDTPTAEWRQEDPGTMPAGDVYGGGSPTGVAFYENGQLATNGAVCFWPVKLERTLSSATNHNRMGQDSNSNAWISSPPTRKRNSPDLTSSVAAPMVNLKRNSAPATSAWARTVPFMWLTWFDARVGGPWNHG